ncbi:hypothetical protein QM453_08845, partial [Streptococcus mitis]|uniref:hypothetical protein n=1 Tax=Streptococcus mitis TaxID=28037 RepID=UPI0039C2A164
DSLSKSFIKQFYFTKTIATMQKSNGKSVAFFEDKRLLSQTLLGGKINERLFTISFISRCLCNQSL